MSFFRRKSHTRHEFIRDLRTAGIEDGDVLIVHSSLQKTGWIAGGPQDLIRAFQDAVGPFGTLVMPTFSFSLIGWESPPFDPWRTASRVGLLTDTFWRLPDVFRSHHPTHSVAAWGRHACDIVRGPVDYEPLGNGSPFDRVREAGGKILMMGVGQNRNSMIHVAEARAEMPYLSIPFTIDCSYDESWFVDEQDQAPKFLAIREMPGSSEGFDVLDDMLIEERIAARVAIGDAVSTVMRAQTLCDFVESLLKENPILFLDCSNPSEITKRRRAIIESILAGRMAS